MREEIQNIITAFSQSTAGYLKVTAGGESLELTKKSPLVEYLSSLSARGVKEPKERKESLQNVISKYVGRYRAPEVALEVGKVVGADTVLGTISSMGIQYNIYSPYSGILAEIFVHDGSVVEFGQPLVLIKEEQ